MGLAEELPVKPTERRLNSPPPKKTEPAAANARRMPASNTEHKKNGFHQCDLNINESR